MRWLAAGVTAWLYGQAALHVPAHAGVSTFGDPPLQAVVWAAAGLGFAIALVMAPDRGSLARRLGLALLVTTLLGQHGVPADPGLRLVLLGVTLLAAAPLLRASPAAWAAAAALVLALPGLLGSVYPHGALLWLAFALPPMALAWLVPSLYPGARATQPALLLLAATATFATLSLWSYVELSDGLDLPLAAVLGTRLRVMGLHPNLAVPHLVVTLVLGAALAASATGRARWAHLVLLAPVLAALAAVRSRTGLATALVGLVLLWISTRRSRFARLALGLTAALVVGLLMVPATGLSDASIGRRSSSMVDKSVSFRSAVWALGRRTVAATPFHGSGPGTTYLQAAQALPGPLDGYPKDDHPHSIVLGVAQALGWPGVAALALLLAVGLRYRRMRSSMLAAIERDRTPAIDFLNGEIVTRGAKHGLATPVNARVVESVWQIARKTLTSSRETLDRLCDPDDRPSSPLIS
jgi:O-antigen ligase